ncbi:MAG: FeoB small GTPase domain-containing protein, partial [Bdellovibrionota bacterium]
MRETMTVSKSHPQENFGSNAQPEAAQFVALVGTPNSGKTTLFNWLTGSRFKTVNYPGATVDYSIGKSHDRYGESFLVMDTPGTYSLDPKSPDERVTFEAIFSHKTYGHASLVVAIADATHLSRQLLLTQQLLEAGFRVVLALTMSDLMKEHGEEIDTKGLSRELGVPVVLIDGRLGGGVGELVETVRRELGSAKKIAEPKTAWDNERIETTSRSMHSTVAPLITKRELSAEAKRATARE